MSEWQNKSDFEINTAVTSFVHGCEKWEFNDTEFYHCGIDGSGYYSQSILDYCNNPSDAWPIIVENQISLLNSDNDLWSAQKWVSNKRISHEFVRGRNALRAAMIVYLEMNGVKP